MSLENEKNQSIYKKSSQKVIIFARESNHSGSEDSLKKQKAKLQEYCSKKGYIECDSVSLIGDRQCGFSMFLQAVRDTNNKGIEKIIMTSTNRICGKLEDIVPIKDALDKSRLTIETLDGSHSVFGTVGLVEECLNSINEDED